MDIERLKKLKKCIPSHYGNRFLPLDYCHALHDLIDEAIARQSVKSEEVQCEIDRLTNVLKQTKEAAEELKKQKYAVNMLPVYDRIKSLELQIAALQAYQPWIPVSERLPEKEDALCQMVFTWSEKKKELEVQHWRHVRYDPDTTHWKPLPEPPKGE